jgi:hypothetical protein
MRIILLACLASLAATPAVAQEFEPPPDAAAPDRGTRLGLEGFGVRGGLDFTQHGRLALGATLDLGQLFVARFRLRASGELSVFNGPNVYVGSLEALYYFTGPAEGDRTGTGWGWPAPVQRGPTADLWPGVVLGFELRFRPTFNWLLEYHGMDWLKENRIYAGLTTRLGG